MSKFFILLGFITSVAVITVGQTPIDFNTFVAPWRDELFENIWFAASIYGFLSSYFLRSLCTICGNEWRVQLPDFRRFNPEKPLWLDWLHSLCTFFELCCLKVAIDICVMHDVLDIGKGQSAAIAMRYLNGMRMFVLWYQTLFLLRPDHARCVLIFAFVVGVGLDFIPQSSIETTIRYCPGNMAADAFDFFLTVPPILLLIHYSEQFHTCSMREIAMGSDPEAAFSNRDREPHVSITSKSASGLFEANRHASSAHYLDSGSSGCSSSVSTPMRSVLSAARRVGFAQAEPLHCPQCKHRLQTLESTVCPSDQFGISGAAGSHASSSPRTSLQRASFHSGHTDEPSLLSFNMQHELESMQQRCGELQQRCKELEAELTERKMMERDLLSRWYHAFACSQTWSQECADSEAGNHCKTAIVPERPRQPLKLDKTCITDHARDHPCPVSRQSSSTFESSSLLSWSSKSSDEPLEGSYACVSKTPVLERFLCAKHMKRCLSHFAGNNGWGDTLLHVFNNLLRLEDSAAALILVSGKTNFKCAIKNELLILEPVDEGYRTKHFEGIKVQDEAFAHRLQDFARHRQGDRDTEGRPTDGAIFVTKSGIVVAAAVKVRCNVRSQRWMKNVGTRHGLAVDGIATLNKSREYPCPTKEQPQILEAMSHCDAVFVLSESNVITVFLGSDGIAYRCCKNRVVHSWGGQRSTDCHECQSESSSSPLASRH